MLKYILEVMNEMSKTKILLDELLIAVCWRLRMTMAAVHVWGRLVYVVASKSTRCRDFVDTYTSSRYFSNPTPVLATAQGASVLL